MVLGSTIIDLPIWHEPVNSAHHVGHGIHSGDRRGPQSVHARGLLPSSRGGASKQVGHEIKEPKQTARTACRSRRSAFMRHESGSKEFESSKQ
jgi:hypothetical protein